MDWETSFEDDVTNISKVKFVKRDSGRVMTTKLPARFASNPTIIKSIRDWMGTIQYNI